MSSPAQPATYELVGESVSVTLDGSGNGTVKWTPGQATSGVGYSGPTPSRNGGYTVDLTGTAVSVSTNTKEAQALTYISYGVQSAAQSDFVGQTIEGSTGDTGSFTAHLRPGDWVTTKWIGGDVGSVATMKLIGTVNPPGV